MKKIGIKISKATEADEEDIRRIGAQKHGNYFGEFSGDPKAMVFVIKENNRVVGFYEAVPVTLIESFYVDQRLLAAKKSRVFAETCEFLNAISSDKGIKLLWFAKIVKEKLKPGIPLMKQGLFKFYSKFGSHVNWRKKITFINW